jgi:hypothetical protein
MKDCPQWAGSEAGFVSLLVIVCLVLLEPTQLTEMTEVLIEQSIQMTYSSFLSSFSTAVLRSANGSSGNNTVQNTDNDAPTHPNPEHLNNEECTSQDAQRGV